MIPKSKLRKAEKALLKAATNGEEIDLAQIPGVRKINGKVKIRAQVLRGIILGKYGEIHERGVRLRNALVREQLDLSHCSIPFPLIMRDCEFGDKEAWKRFSEEHNWEDDNFEEHWEKAVPVMLDRASLHLLQLDNSLFHGGIFLERANVNTSLFMKNSTFTGPAWLAGGRIEGQLSANGAKFKAREGHALHAQGAEIAGDCFLNNAEFDATASLAGVRIGGQLSATGAKFGAKEGHALNAQEAKIAGGCFLHNAEFDAVAWLAGTRISGQLSANGAKFGAKERHALNAQDVEIKGGAFFREETEFTGEVCFVSAHLGALLMEGASLEVRKFIWIWALNASNCQVDGDCMLKDGFNAAGTVDFNQAKIGGSLDLSGSTLKSHPLSELFSSEELSKTLSLREARIRQLILPKEKDCCPRGVVDLTRAHVGTLEDYAEGWNRHGTDGEHVILDGLTYDHLLHPAGMPDGDAHGGKAIADARERWLMGQKPEHLAGQFRTQPWTQLIKTLRRDGHSGAAEELEIRFRRRLRGTMLKGRPLRRFADWFLEKTAGYGYHPWRTVFIGLVTICAFALLWAVAMLGCGQEGCRDEGVFVRTDVAGYSRTIGVNTSDPARQTYPDFNPLAFSFDLFIPLFSFGYQETWGVNTGWKPIYRGQIPYPSCWNNRGKTHCRRKEAALLNLNITWGGILYLFYLAEILLGAILTAIAVAGFTGLLQRQRNE